jgi:hypothetical protein
LEVLPVTHADIYFGDALEELSGLAIQWFQRHL